MYALLTGLFVYTIIDTNSAKSVNVEVTLHPKEVSTLFDAGELWALNYVDTNANTTNTLIKANVVITEDKYKSLLSSKSTTITDIKMIYDNVEEVLKEEKSRLDNRTRWTSKLPRNVFFEEYRDWIEYELFIAEFLVVNSEIASIEFIGETIQGRNIPMITLSTGGSGDENKPGFYIMAELHAREWLANAATMWIMNEIGDKYRDGDETITEILENINIYIVPTVNIDGYIYSWTTDRNWRKNRRNNGGGSFGVDLNRNYGSPDFCGIGASSNPNSNTYCGTGAGSEPETIATYNIINDASYNFRAGWDMHTVGPLLLWPYAYTFNAAPNKPALESYGSELEATIRDVNGVTYTSQQAAELYPCAGTAVDYFYMYAGITDYPITFEGRGPGFAPPASNIIPSGQEIYAGFVMTAQNLF